MWALIDNYDSFTYILRDYLQQLQEEVVVFESDRITAAQLAAYHPRRIILSPGPGNPDQAGATLDIIHHFHRKTPILGVCLGHQALGVYFGATLTKSTPPVHGKIATVVHNQEPLFSGIPRRFQVMRYHSLVLKDWSAAGLLPLAQTEAQLLMAFRHPEFPAIGLQFHPESILTEHGFTLLKNWSGLYPNR